VASVQQQLSVTMSRQLSQVPAKDPTRLRAGRNTASDANIQNRTM
jgi:hypothetical protein